MFQSQCGKSRRCKSLAWACSHWCWYYRLCATQFQTALLHWRLAKGRTVHTVHFLVILLLTAQYRYLNMDYLFLSSMQSSSDIMALNISYDIACQWSKHLWTRMSAFPHQYHIKHHEKSIVFLVPKFHLPAHIAKCQTSFSFNFIKGVGRTDGEAPERGWADINPIATSTREMGPGSRRDTLDDHFNDWNWKKICAMGEFLASHYYLNS